jgi:hypothetical protein
MKLPHCEQATVREQKITGYLLSPTHPTGGSKARYFSHHGFSAAVWQELAEALRRHAAENEVTEILQTQRGVSYTVEGEMLAPSGARLKIRSVWFQDIGEPAPHFVTAYPLKKGAGR